MTFLSSKSMSPLQWIPSSLVNSFVYPNVGLRLPWVLGVDREPGSRFIEQFSRIASSTPIGLVSNYTSTSRKIWHKFVFHVIFEKMFWKWFKSIWYFQFRWMSHVQGKNNLSCGHNFIFPRTWNNCYFIISLHLRSILISFIFPPRDLISKMALWHFPPRKRKINKLIK